MENALNKHYIMPVVDVFPTHAIGPIGLNGLISWIAQASSALCWTDILSLTRGDEAMAAAKPLLGPSSDPSYDGDNGKKLDMDSHLWREECFHVVEEKLTGALPH